MLRIAVTGGIASGKSTVVHIFRELGAVVVDHDEISRGILGKNTPGLAAVVAKFEQKILTADKALNRAALAQIVFNHDADLQWLNSLTHPLIEAEARRQEDLAFHANSNAVVVHDIPLFVGSWLDGASDFSVLVTAPEELRIERMIRERKMSEADARARIAAQLTDSEIAKHVDSVLENLGSPVELREKVTQLWHKITASGTASR